MKFLVLSLAAAALTATLPCSAADEKPVPTTEEPFHRTVFENAYVRMLDVRMAEGVRNMFHVHTAPTVVIYLTAVTNQSETWGQPGTTPRVTKPGDSRYANYDEKPLTHRVTNQGRGEFRVWDIELLRPVAPGPFPAAGAAALRTNWEENRVRSSNVLLDPAGTVSLQPGPCAHVVVPIADGLVALEHSADQTQRVLNAGDFAFFAPRTGVELRNTGSNQLDVVVLELR